MAITDKKKGVWGLDQTYNKINSETDTWAYQYPDPSPFASPKFMNWGYAGRGQIGHINTTNLSSPIQLTGNWKLTPNFGMDQRVTTKTDGTLWGLGKNSVGQLGQNNHQSPGNHGLSSPVQIGSDATWNTAYMASGGSGKATKTDGTLWAWGGSWWGEAAQNSANSGGQYYWSSPVQIPGTWGLGINKISGSGNWSAGIKADGTLWCWGHNGSGALGQNQAYPGLYGTSSPVQVPGTDWHKLLTGSQVVQAGAIKVDGTLWMWGSNVRGELGENNTTNYSSPVQIPGTYWANGRFMNESVILSRTYGTLWGMGYAGYGQLGKTSGSVSSPMQIPGTNWDIDQLAGGWNNAIALKTDGTLWSWGYNSQGQLADNTALHRSSPTQIPGQWDSVSSGGQSYWAEMTGNSNST